MSEFALPSESAASLQRFRRGLSSTAPPAPVVSDFWPSVFYQGVWFSSLEAFVLPRTQFALTGSWHTGLDDWDLREDALYN